MAIFRRKTNETKLVFPKRKLNAGLYDVLNDESLINFWKSSTPLSIDAALDPNTRRRLRAYARKETANNSYAFGVATAISNAVVGTGPRLQILDRLPGDKHNQAEHDFEDWAQEVNLAEILRAMRFARVQDGESFGLMYTNEKLSGAVKLGFMAIDAERVAGEYLKQKPREVDGITLDEYGVPQSYRILTRHPGDSLLFDWGGRQRYVQEAKEYPAWQIVHWFRKTTPEQHRGASELAPALALFALLRRYTLAVVTAAETAADFAAIMYTDSVGDYNAPNYTANPFETVDIERGLMMTMPDGWKVSQLKSEQPTTTYESFKRSVLAEIGRAMGVPVNVIMNDSSQYNYASGRLDMQEFQRQTRIDQAQTSQTVIRPIFRQWWREYSLQNDLPRATPKIEVYWDGSEHVDPDKEAKAQQRRLASLTTTLAAEYAKQGKDWEHELAQIARERQKMKEYGLTFDEIAPDLVEQNPE